MSKQFFFVLDRLLLKVKKYCDQRIWWYDTELAYFLKIKYNASSTFQLHKHNVGFGVFILCVFSSDSSFMHTENPKHN